MCLEHLRVIGAVYASALLPFLMLSWRRRRGKVPGWVTQVYLDSLLLRWGRF